MVPTLARLAEAKGRFLTNNGIRKVRIANGTFPIFIANTGTGCNIEFISGRGDVYRLKIHTPSKIYNIYCTEEEFYMADCVITWFVYPNEAKQMLAL
jgi:hypothetical protein